MTASHSNEFPCSGRSVCSQPALIASLEQERPLLKASPILVEAHGIPNTMTETLPTRIHGTVAAKTTALFPPASLAAEIAANVPRRQREIPRKLCQAESV